MVDVVDRNLRRHLVLRRLAAVFRRLVRRVDGAEQAQRLDDVGAVEDAQIGRHLGLAAGFIAEFSQLLIELVAADLAQIVATGIEEEALDELRGVRRGDGVARAEAVINLLERFLFARGGVVAHRLEQHAAVPRHIEHFNLVVPGLFELAEHRRRRKLIAAGEQRVGLGVADILGEDEHLEAAVIRLRGLQHLIRVEILEDLAVRAVAEAAQEHRREELAALLAAVHEHPDALILVELELNPRAAVRDDAHRIERRAVRVDFALRADTRGAVQLRDDDALGAVDHKGAVVRHERNFAHVHRLFIDGIAILQTERHVERPGICHALAQRRQRIVLGLRVERIALFQRVADELQDIVSIVGLNRENVLENTLQSDVPALGRSDVRLQELLVGLGLNFDLVRRINNRRELAVDGSLYHRVPR